jgi:ketosteroid isomerase-like protein
MLPAMRNGEVVREFLTRMQARDWEGAHGLLAPDVVVEWPATGERFAGADAVVAVNRDYPEGWSIDVVGVVEATDGRTVLSEIEVPQEDVGVFAAASVWDVTGGVIVRGREYWVQCGGEEPPAWRANYAGRYTGRLRNPL